MYESNGPDVKIRGNASHIAEKYLQLARDAQSSGDPIAAENYYQHAEHYFRLIAAAQEHLRQSQPAYYQQQQQQPGEMRGNSADDSFEDGDDDQPAISGEPFAPREQQPFYSREQQQQPNQNQTPHQPPQHYQPRQQNFQPANEGDIERLPSFITGGQPQHQQPVQQGQDGNGSGSGPNGQNGYDGSPDRFPLHRRRRRHRGPRDHMSGEGDAPPSGPRSAED
jgi:hypothetical protein